MGEFVERSLEDLVPTFEQLQRVQIFSPLETQSIIKRCRQLEYKIQKQVKSSDDFLQYATYLKNVYKLIGKRRAAIKYTHKRDEIEDVINLKIDNVYRRVCERFPQEMKLWKKRIAFNKSRKRYSSVSKIYVRMLQLHNSDVSLWREAAEYEYRTRLAVGSARNLLQSALRVHKKSIELYTALLDIELSFVDKLIERRKALKAKTESKAATSQNDDGMDEPIVDYTDVDDLSTTAQDAMELVRAVVDEAKSKFSAIPPELYKLIGSFHMICSKHKCAEALTKELHDQLFSGVEFNSITQAWVCRARDVYSQGKSAFDIDDMEQYFTVDSKKEVMANDQKVFAMWNAGLKETNFARDLFAEAVNFAAMMVCDCSKCDVGLLHARVFFYKSLMNRAEKLNVANFPTPAQYDDFLQIIQDLDPADMNTGVNCEHLIDGALQRNPKSVSLWCTRINLEIDSDKHAMSTITKNVHKLFNQALKKIDPACTLDLWRLALQFTMSDKKTPKAQETCRSLFESSFLMPSVVNVHTKCMYLKWCMIFEDKNVKKIGHQQYVHNEFQRLALMRPNGECFYEEYLKIAMSWPTVNVEHIRSVFEQYVSECGANTSKVWLSYAKWESTNDALRLPSLYQRACQQLKKASEHDEFVKMYSLTISNN